MEQRSKVAVEGEGLWQSFRSYEQLFKKQMILLMAEIRRSPVEVGSFSHYFFLDFAPSKRWLFGISAINIIKSSTQVRDGVEKGPHEIRIPSLKGGKGRSFPSPQKNIATFLGPMAHMGG